MTTLSSVSTMDALTLSKYDDLLSDVLLDQVALWFETRKMFPKHRKARTNQQATIHTVQRLASGSITLADAVSALLEQEYIAAFLRHKSALRVSDFKLHAGRYFSMYLPEAGYEITQTTRYRPVTGKAESRVIATKRYTLGMVINLCSGSVANLSEREIARLEGEQADFSVMWWSKKKSMCLFLGPARFVNHDCDSNCRFTALGSDAICFQALRTIEPGDEITTDYGANYFGEANCECLCATCEKYARGWYASHSAADSAPTTPASTDSESTAAEKMRTRNNGRHLSATPGAPKRRAVDGAGCAVCGESTAGASQLLPAEILCGSAVPVPAQPSVCQRCSRHQLLFGVPWPDRITRKHAAKHRAPHKRAGAKAEGRAAAHDSKRQRRRQSQSEALMKPARQRRKPTIYHGDPHAGISEMFARRVPGTPVFVDPLDSQLAYWWPALITDSGDAIQVRYFEDSSYSQCAPAEVVAFDPRSDVFAKWAAAAASMVDDLGVRMALAYFEWRFLAVAPAGGGKDSPASDKTLIGLQDTVVGVNEASALRQEFDTADLEHVSLTALPELCVDDFFGDCSGSLARRFVAPYLAMAGDDVMAVDARDGVAYRARVLDVEVICNEFRLGLFYYVHFLGWNSRYDEWVSPSRVTRVLK